jgi:hypothetical protein
MDRDVADIRGELREFRGEMSEFRAEFVDYRRTTGCSTRCARI